MLRQGVGKMAKNVYFTTFLSLVRRFDVIMIYVHLVPVYCCLKAAKAVCFI